MDKDLELLYDKYVDVGVAKCAFGIVDVDDHCYGYLISAIMGRDSNGKKAIDEYYVSIYAFQDDEIINTPVSGFRVIKCKPVVSYVSLKRKLSWIGRSIVFCMAGKLFDPFSMRDVTIENDELIKLGKVGEKRVRYVRGSKAQSSWKNRKKSRSGDSLLVL